MNLYSERKYFESPDIIAVCPFYTRNILADVNHTHSNFCLKQKLFGFVYATIKHQGQITNYTDGKYMHSTRAIPCTFVS
jgi:hypothetical protein